jgi:hypothetical protein
MLTASPALKPDTVARWSRFFGKYRRIVMYTADPGACALVELFRPMLHALGNDGGWYVEGWSGQRHPELQPADGLLSALEAGATLLLGSQVRYARTHEMLETAKMRQVGSIFVFDHWKNYGEHFRPDLLPDTIVVPDALGRKALLSAIGQQHADRVVELPHVGVEAAALRILSYPEREPGMLAVLLDPTVAGGGLGYDWQTVLARLPALIERHAPEARVQIKPHPRQSPAEVAAWMQSLGMSPERFRLVDTDTERLMAAADEVWGMTTIALVAAHHAGKRIRSIQSGRNAAGRAASNHFIEPFLVEE